MVIEYFSTMLKYRLISLALTVIQTVSDVQKNKIK